MKKVLSNIGVAALICGFIVIVCSPGHVDAFNGTMLDVIKQFAIGVGMCVTGVFLNVCAK